MADADDDALEGEALPTIEGRVVAFGLELAAADILSASHCESSPAEARRFLFEAIDRSLARRITTGDVIVAEEMTGTAPGAHAALAALAAAGVVALVARRFDAAISRAARACALPAVGVDNPGFLRTGDRVRLDLDAAKIANLSSGDRAAIRALGEAERSHRGLLTAPRAAP